MQDLNITYLQSNIQWEKRQANLSLFEQKLDHIPEDTQLVILPEMFDTGFSMEPHKLKGPLENETLNWMKKMAVKHETAICGSTIASNSRKYYNRFYWVYPDGSELHYDKKHLFRMGREPKYYASGGHKLIIEYLGWHILPLVCYDLRFPVWSKNTAEKDQPVYDLLIYVANWPDSRKDVWKTLLKARALENQAYCIGVNRVGKDGNNLSYSGDSVAYSFKGNVIKQSVPYLEDNPSFSLDKEKLQQFRKKFPVYKDWDEFEIK